MSPATEVFNEGLYATLAQVIPVVFILLAVDLRLFTRGEDRDESISSAYYLTLVVVGLVVSEAIALFSLDRRESPPDLGVFIIWMSLGFAGGHVLGHHMGPRVKALTSTSWSRAYLRFVIGVILVLTLLATAGVVAALTIYLVAALAMFGGYIAANAVEDFSAVPWRRIFRRSGGEATHDQHPDPTAADESSKE